MSNELTKGNCLPPLVCGSYSAAQYDKISISSKFFFYEHSEHSDVQLIDEIHPVKTIRCNENETRSTPDTNWSPDEFNVCQALEAACGDVHFLVKIRFL